jgi:hypothetical protein
MVKVYKIKYINCYLYCEELHGRQAQRAQRLTKEFYDNSITIAKVTL